MRPEDWQRWLDAQFLDKEPLPEPRTPVQPPSPQAGTAELEENVVPAPPPPQAQGTAPAVKAPSEANIPSFENYLPAFRRQGPEAPAGAEDASPVGSVAPPPQDLKEKDEGLEEDQEEAVPEAADRTPSPTGASEPSAAAPALGVSDRQEPPAAHPQTAQVQPEAATAAEAVRLRGGVRTRQTRIAEKATAASSDLTAADLWNLVPRHIQTLIAMGSDEGVQRNYKRAFKESRIELISRLLDPTLSLEDTARLLKVCPTTVRRYTNKGLLRHQRTTGDQRRFKLSDVLAFLEAQSTSREA
ncbi:MAG: helix-turn-helix domain-containing protein [Chthonomonadales bacterium]